MTVGNAAWLILVVQAMLMIHHERSGEVDGFYGQLQWFITSDLVDDHKRNKLSLSWFRIIMQQLVHFIGPFHGQNREQ